MCGRFSFVVSREKLKKQLNVAPKEELSNSYNVAPTQDAYVLTGEKPGELQRWRWGLIPHWANDISVGNNLINARAEGIAGKPSFRIPIRHKRCLILADSFYEWQQKQPYRILPTDNGLIVMAGIWDEWRNSAGKLYRTFAIITTTPNKEMAELHDRMPVILPDVASQQKWLSDLPLEEALSMLKPLPDGALKYYPVTPLINSVKYDGPDAHNTFVPPKELRLFD